MNCRTSHSNKQQVKKQFDIYPSIRLLRLVRRLRLLRHLDLQRQHHAVFGAASPGHAHRVASQRHQPRLQVQLIGRPTGHCPSPDLRLGDLQDVSLAVEPGHLVGEHVHDGTLVQL